MTGLHKGIIIALNVPINGELMTEFQCKKCNFGGYTSPRANEYVGGKASFLING